MAFDNHVSDANDDDDSHDGDTDDVDDIQSERMAGCDGNMAADVPDGATHPLLPDNIQEDAKGGEWNSDNVHAQHEQYIYI